MLYNVSKELRKISIFGIILYLEGIEFSEMLLTIISSKSSQIQYYKTEFKKVAG
jgi:hypothetical protein